MAGVECAILTFGEFASGVKQMLPLGDGKVERGLAQLIGHGLRAAADEEAAGSSGTSVCIRFGCALAAQTVAFLDLLSPSTDTERLKVRPRRSEGLPGCHLDGVQEQLLTQDGSIAQALKDATSKYQRLITFLGYLPRQRFHTVLSWFDIRRTAVAHGNSPAAQQSTRIWLVNLASNEPRSTSPSQQIKPRRDEVSSLEAVFRCLSQGASHVPYRDAALTRLLQQAISHGALQA